MSLSFSVYKSFLPQRGNIRTGIVDITLDGSYSAGGWAIAGSSIAAGMTLFNLRPPAFKNGYALEWDHANAKLKAYSVTAVAAQPVSTGAVVDSDDAATAGTDVFVGVDADGVFAYLETEAAGNADTKFAVGSGGPEVFVDDATTATIVLYFDEDATAADSRFLVISPTGQDLFLRTSTGSLIRLKHDASAASNGVAVHIDDDAANTHERLLFVSPTDADGAYTTDDAFTLQTGEGIVSAAAEISGSELSSAVIRCDYIGA